MSEGNCCLRMKSSSDTNWHLSHVAERTCFLGQFWLDPLVPEIDSCCCRSMRRGTCGSRWDHQWVARLMLKLNHALMLLISSAIFYQKIPMHRKRHMYDFTLSQIMSVVYVSQIIFGWMELTTDHICGVRFTLSRPDLFVIDFDSLSPWFTSLLVADGGW